MGKRIYRKPLLFFSILVVTVLLTVPVYPQEFLENSNNQPDKGNKQSGLFRYYSFLKNDMHNLTGYRPRIKKLNWKRICVLSGTVLFASFIEKDISGHFKNSTDSNVSSFFKNFEPLGDVKKLNLTGALSFFGSMAFQKQKLADASFALMEGLIITEGAVIILKQAIGRARPGHGKGNRWFKSRRNGYDSLPSGHTTMAFTAASIVSEYYPELRFYVYGTAMGVGIQRITSNTHWITDVFISGFLGYFTGKLTARSHLKIYPIVTDRDSAGLSLSISLNIQ